MAKKFTHTAAARAAISAGNKGKKRTPEQIARMSAAQKGRKRPPFSAEWLANLSKAHKGIGLGVKHTPERCARISAALKGKKRSPEVCAAISARQKGKKHKGGWHHTEEAKAKMRGPRGPRKQDATS